MRTPVLPHVAIVDGEGGWRQRARGRGREREIVMCEMMSVVVGLSNHENTFNEHKQQVSEGPRMAAVAGIPAESTERKGRPQ